MAQKTETLTPYQESQIIPHRDYWLNYILSCENSIDKEKAKKGIEWLYKFCGKKAPVIVFMDSPFGVQVAANLIKSNIRDNIWANIRDNIGANIRDNIRANIRDNIGANIGDNIGANIGANIRDNIGANIWANIRANIRDNIRGMKYETFSWYGNVRDYGWVAWIDYFLQMKLINTDKKEDFDNFKELLLSGVFEMIQYDGVCIVSNMPNVIKRDENGRLHSISEESIMFKDGFGQYYIHGRYLSEKLFNSVLDKSLTTEQFFKEENEEVKSALISMMQECYGDEYVFRFFEKDLKEIDNYVDKKEEKYLIGTTGGMNIGVYTLFKGTINEEDVAYVRCYCPSTDRMFFLGVDPNHKNAKDAIASLYRVPKKLKSHIQTINRQGEIYSTTFDKKGLSILKKLSKQDIQDTTTVSGDEYFDFIKYEY